MHARPHAPSNVAAPVAVPARGDEDAARLAASGAPENVPDRLEWTVPARETRPGRVLLVLGSVSVTAWVALGLFGNPLPAIVAGMAVFGAVAEGLFPIHCRITPKGVSTRCAWQIRSMPWESIKSVRAGADGIHLSPFTRNTPLGRLRGVCLRFAEGNDSAVLGLVRRYWKKDPVCRDTVDRTRGNRKDRRKGVAS